MLSVIRSQAGPVALSIRRAWYSFVAAQRRRPGEPVLLTGLDDHRSGSYVRLPAALVICSVSQRASRLASGATTSAMSLACPGGAAGQPVDLLQRIGRVSRDLRLYLVCPQPDLMGADTGRRSFPGAVVHRSARHQPEQRRPGAGEAADGPVHGWVRPGRHPDHTESGFRGREKRRSAGAAGASHEVIRSGSRREASRELVRVGNRRDRKMVCQSSVRGHHAFVFCASGGGATGHHSHRLHRGEDGGRAVLRSAPAALRRAQADHHLRSLFARSGGGPEADGYRGHLPGRLGHVGQGIGDGGPGTRPGQLSALPGARRGRADRARPAHGGPEPALRPLAPERGAACCLPRGRLSAIHHRRRRHRTRRRRARPESDPSFRRGRGPGLPHRGPEAGR